MSIWEEIEKLIQTYENLGIGQQVDYDKFYLYSLITHSTAIEGSTITEVENQLLFDEGLTSKGKNINEYLMNLDLKAAYEASISMAKAHTEITTEWIKKMASLVMKSTGSTYKTALGEFSSANGDIRLVNVSAGIGGASYMDFHKVPNRLQNFCNNLNNKRKNIKKKKKKSQYELSFDAHYELVTIHPWVDGNGRMARLLMNHLQFEYGLIPTKILKEDKSEYIQALIDTRRDENLQIFRDFMFKTLRKNLQQDIQSFVDSQNEVGRKSSNSREKNKGSREKILELLRENPKLTTAGLAQAVGISSKGVEKQLAHLKREGLLRRIGPDKGGHWEVVDL